MYLDGVCARPTHGSDAASASARMLAVGVSPIGGNFVLRVRVSQDTLPSPLHIGCLFQYYYSYCTTSDVYCTPVSTIVSSTVDTAVSTTLYGSNYCILQYGSG